MQPRSINARFSIVQSIIHNDYIHELAYQFLFFAQYTLNESKYLDPRTSKVYHIVKLITNVDELFTEFYYMFYVDGVKIIPSDLSLLTPYALAHVIMCDGSFHKHTGSLYLCTDGFTVEDTTYLKSTYGVSYTLQKSPSKLGKIGLSKRIYIPRHSVDTIRKAVLPYMVPSMLYKLGI